MDFFLFFLFLCLLIEIVEYDRSKYHLMIIVLAQAFMIGNISILDLDFSTTFAYPLLLGTTILTANRLRVVTYNKISPDPDEDL